MPSLFYKPPPPGVFSGVDWGVLRIWLPQIAKIRHKTLPSLTTKVMKTYSVVMSLAVICFGGEGTRLAIPSPHSDIASSLGQKLSLKGLRFHPWQFSQRGASFCWCSWGMGLGVGFTWVVGGGAKNFFSLNFRQSFRCGSDAARTWLGRVFGCGRKSLAEVKGKRFWTRGGFPVENEGKLRKGVGRVGSEAGTGKGTSKSMHYPLANYPLVSPRFSMRICTTYRAPLPAEWIFRRCFSLNAWILQGFCREFCCGFLCGFSVLRLKGRKAPRNPQKKIHSRIYDKIHALGMKSVTTNALHKGSPDTQHGTFSLFMESQGNIKLHQICSLQVSGDFSQSGFCGNSRIGVSGKSKWGLSNGGLRPLSAICAQSSTIVHF